MTPHKKIRVQHLLDMKKSEQKIAAVTAYDRPTAAVADQAGVDLVLVGDSLGNVILGYESTIPVTMDQMIHHCAAVTRTINRPLIVGDMPFMSYKVSVEQALTNAGRFLSEGGVQAVKVEGCDEVAPMIEAIVQAGIPVLGHIGLTPQSVHALSGYRIQGRRQEVAERLKNNALRLQEMGCFAVVLELVTANLAAKISAMLEIPTIGIGSGAGCDGQILIINDLLGFNPEPSGLKFVKEYANLFDQAREAVSRYAEEIRAGQYPDDEHSHQ